MRKTRTDALLAVLRGFIVAAAVTIGSIALAAAAILWLGLSDNWLRILNQLIKVLSIVAGVTFAVGVGGHRGFVTGMTLAMLYMLLGYGLCLFLGGGAYDTADMLGEILLGAALGGVTGAVLANLPARSPSPG